MKTFNKKNISKQNKGRKTNNENNIIREEKEKNNEDDLEYISINDVKSLYKTKVNSCKQVRVKKHFKND